MFLMSYKKLTLPNDLRVLFAPQPGNLATTVLVLVEAGSKYETKNLNGLSHFLEHMCFKGTTNRPTALKISSELDALGAEYNAFTSHEYTGYFAKVQSGHNEKALEIISDLYLNPIFDATEIEKEKGVIIEELNMYEDMPQRKIGDIFMHLLYGDQPAGWDVGGEKEIIRTLNRDNFISYRGQHYLAPATLIVISGDFNEAKMTAAVEKLFANMPVGEKAGKLAVKEVQTAPQVFVKNKKSDQTHLMIGCRTFSLFDPRQYTLEVLSDILGGGMSSRLFQRIREELGAAYYVRAMADLYTDHGYLAAAIGAEHSKLNTVITATLEEFKKLTDKPVPSDELARAKSHLAGGLLLGLETSDSLGVFYGGQEILKHKVTTPDELLKKINAVTSAEIQSLAKEIFTNNKLNLALIGPYEDEAPFKKLLCF